MRYTKKGFTLLELLVVIAIIGLIYSIVSIVFNSARASARDARRLSDIKELSKALEIRFFGAGDYPKSPQQTGAPGWITSCEDPFNPDWIRLIVAQDFIPTLPIDPLNSDPVCYRYQGRGSDFKLAVFMEKEKNKTNYAARDGGLWDDWYEIFTEDATWSWP